MVYSSLLAYHIWREKVNIDEMKARLRALLHQRDMLAYEHDSLELFDLIEEVEEEIRELQEQIRRTA